MEQQSIVGKVHTPNLGIEKIILNSISNPEIRFLVFCRKELSHDGYLGAELSNAETALNLNLKYEQDQY